RTMSGSIDVSERPRVLLVDDDRVLMERVAVYLKAKNFDVTCTESVFSVAAQIGALRPNAIVLDVQMPALSGDKVASVLSRLCTVPIVFYSAVADEDGETLAAGHPNACFVSKASGMRALWEKLVEITGEKNSAVGL